MGGTSDDDPFYPHTLQIKNGHYIVTAYTLSKDGDVSGNHGLGDVFVGEVDSDGNWIWKKTYGGSAVDEPFSVQLGNDSGYIVSGSTGSNNGDVSGNHGGYDAWILRLNNSGDIMWQKCYGGSRNERALSIIALGSNGYIFTGYASSADGDVTGLHDTTESGASDIWTVKLDEDGNIEWSKCYGGYDVDYGTDIKVFPDNNYYITGYVTGNSGDVSGNHGGIDIWLAKIDNNGNLLSHKCLGGSNNDYPSNFDFTNDNNIILVGYTTSSDGDVSGFHIGPDGKSDGWMVKLSLDGNIIWQKCLGGSSSLSGFQELLSQTINLSNGNFIAAGSTDSNDGDVNHNYGSSDVWMVKVSKDGELMWEKTYGGSGRDYATSITLLPDNKIAFLATTFSNDQDVSGNHGGGDMWLVKLNTTGILPLHLLSFTATPNHSINLLRWSTADEINTDYFEIQRSSDGRDFSAIGKVKAAGNAKNDYSFKDAAPLQGINYYRLKMTDKDSRYSYSEIRSVSSTRPFAVSISPNPVKGAMLNVNISNAGAAAMQFAVVSMDGKSMLSQKMNIAANATNQSFNISSLPKGVYYLKVTAGNEQRVLKFVKGE